MMDESVGNGGKRMKSLIELCDVYFWPLVLGALGAAVQCLRGRWLGWWNFLISQLTAAFGVIVSMSILPHYMPYSVACGISGFVAYSGGTIIDALLERLKKEIETREVHK